MAAIALIIIIVLFQKNYSKQKKIYVFHTKIDSLEKIILRAKNSISYLQEKVSNLEESLSEVEHFDENSSVYRGFSSRSSGGISFTGQALKTQIDGEFEGWEGETIFKMLNGTIWQQSAYSYIYHYAYMPDVLIYRKNGTFYMRVEGLDQEIAVKQIN